MRNILHKSLVLSIFIFLSAQIKAQLHTNTVTTSTSIVTLPGTLNDDLVAYYPFAGNVNDRSGNKNHGTINGVLTLTNDRFGNPDNAYYFNGNPFNYINIPNSSVFNAPTGFSISAWIKFENPELFNFPLLDVTSIQSAFHIISKGKYGDKHYGLFIDHKDKQRLTFNYKDGNVSGNSFTSNNLAIDGFWHHIIGVCDYSNLKFKLYIDNTIAKEVPLFTFAGEFLGNKYPLLIGRHFNSFDGSGGNEYPFIGVIDDVSIYRRVLTSQEISEVKNLPSTVTGIESIRVPIVSLYPNPNNGSFTIESDVSGVNVTIMDLLGNEVKRYKFHSTQKKLYIEDDVLGRGLYFVIVSIKDKKVIKRLVIP